MRQESLDRVLDDVVRAGSRGGKHLNLGPDVFEDLQQRVNVLPISGRVAPAPELHVHEEIFPPADEVGVEDVLREHETFSLIHTARCQRQVVLSDIATGKRPESASRRSV